MTHEIPLGGGDVDVGEHVAVRVGDTVRRQVGPHTQAVHALLRHFERVGFDGAPRVPGFDERGRWDLCGPGSHLYDIASAANFWVPLAHEERAAELGLSNERAGERLRLLCDAYGLELGDREALLDVVAHRNEMGYEIHGLWGGVERRPGWREMWDRGSGETILRRNAWFEAHRGDLLAFLR